jgi:hypothetical protein
MTFKDLQKLVQSHPNGQQNELLERLNDKPLWIWNQQQHKLEDIKTDGDCCFNHIIGLPQKDGNDKPFYDYQQIIFDSLVVHDGNANKYIWIKKAIGLGVLNPTLMLLFVLHRQHKTYWQQLLF